MGKVYKSVNIVNGMKFNAVLVVGFFMVVLVSQFSYAFPDVLEIDGFEIGAIHTDWRHNENVDSATSAEYLDIPDGACFVEIYSYIDEDKLLERAYSDFDLGDEGFEDMGDFYQSGNSYVWSYGKYLFYVSPDIDPGEHPREDLCDNVFLGYFDKYFSEGVDFIESEDFNDGHSVAAKSDDVDDDSTDRPDNIIWSEIETVEKDCSDEEMEKFKKSSREEYEDCLAIRNKKNSEQAGGDHEGETSHKLIVGVEAGGKQYIPKFIRIVPETIGLIGENISNNFSKMVRSIRGLFINSSKG